MTLKLHTPEETPDHQPDRLADWEEVARKTRQAKAEAEKLVAEWERQHPRAKLEHAPDMDRCHYITAGSRRILIPGCMGTAVHYDCRRPLDFCTCPPRSQRDEIERLRAKVKRLEARLEALEKKSR